MYGECYDISVVIARPFNHTGPGQSETYVVSDFCKQIAKMELRTSQEGERRLRVGNLDSVRDFLDVRDVVSAYTTLAQRGEAGQVYNVCSGRGVSMGEILELALQMTEVKIHVEVDRDKCRAEEKQFRVGDNGKLLALRNWTPRFTLQQTIADTLEAWRMCLASGVDRA